MRSALTISLISSFVVTFLLFYMDESYFDLRWMSNPGNWIAFMVYVVIIGLLFFIPLSVLRLIFRKLLPSGPVKATPIVTGILACTFVGVAFFIWLFKNG